MTEIIEPKCKKLVEEDEEFDVYFCSEEPRCHYCDDPYACTIPHYLYHLLKKEHGD